MNAVTEAVLASLQDIVDISKAVPDQKNPEITILDAEHDISFGVYDNEIIVFFFYDHHHFYVDWDENYVQSAADMLRQLFIHPLLKQETFKGTKCIRREWFYLLENGRKESIAGPWFLGGRFVNPFSKKSAKRTLWRYLRQAGRFIECP